MAKEAQLPAWSDLNAAKSRKVATALMESVDRVAAGVSMLTTPDTTRTIIKPTVGTSISCSRRTKCTEQQFLVEMKSLQKAGRKC